MGYPVDGWTEGPGLPQSAWRYKWLVGGLVLLGILGASLFSASQSTLYEGVVHIFVTPEGAAGDPERTVTSHAQFIESPTVSDRAIALTGNRLTRKEFEKRLTVEPSANGDFITVRARDTTPTNAVGLADAVELAYREILSEQKRAAADQTIAALEGMQARLGTELAQIRQQRRTADSPALAAAEQAKKRQMEATANNIEETSADTAVPPPALQDKAAVPDEPVQPKPVLTGAIGAVVGLVIGVALAWFLAARQRVRPGEDSAEARIAHDRKEPVKFIRDLVARTRTKVRPPRAALDAEATESEIGQLAQVDDNPVAASVGQAVNSMDNDPDLLYSLAEWLESQHQNFPQITAERLRDRLLFDRVAVLLRTDDGLDLAGCVGWHPNGVRPVRRDDRRILNKLGGNGVRRIGSADRRALVNAGLLGNEAQTVIVAPLKHENFAFGVLLVGQEELESEAPPQANGSFAGIGSFARSVSPDLHAWLLLHKLREQLASHGKAQEQTARPAESESPSAESVPSAKSEPPSAKSVPPESVPPESVPPESVPPESVPPESVPSAESAPPESTPPESTPPESVPPSAESEPPSAWPMYPADSESPSAPDSQPASSVDQQDEHQVARS